MGVRKSVSRIGPALPGAKLPSSTMSDDVDDSRADQKAGGDDCRGHAALRSPEGRIDRREPEPEIGDAHFIWNGLGAQPIEAADSSGEEDVSDKGPQSLHAEREEEEIAQQLVDDDGDRERPRRTRDGDRGEQQRRDPEQDRHIPDDGDQALAGVASSPQRPASIASSSSIRPSITLSPIDQKSGSEASRPNGASSSLWCLVPPAVSMSR